MARSLGTTIKDTLSFNKKKEKELLQKKPPVPLIDNKGNNSLELYYQLKELEVRT